MSDVGAPSAEGAIRKLTVAALSIVVLLGGVMGGLAATTHLSGAVIASGMVVVDTYVKPVQHQKGGTVGQIFVKNGDLVEAGQILIHLDDTQTRANLAIVTKRLNELSARTARLVAERDGTQSIAFSEELLAKASDPEAARSIEGEKRLFANRRSSLVGRKAQLRERIEQLKQEAEGLVAQETGKRQEIALIEKELESIQRLFDQGLVPANRVYALQREAASLTGELGNLVATEAQTKGKVTETELQIIQIDDDQRSEVSDQLRQAEGDIGEYSERLVAAQDDLQRIDIRAPQGGIVHQLAVHASGAVIAPGEAIMQIVPDRDALVAEVKLMPTDIDQVSIGQMVHLRFSAFSQRNTPELNGVVTSVAADLTSDQRSGLSYYVVRTKVSDGEWQRLGQVTPVPGMPVEAFIQTGERTALAYLTKPLMDQVARAFKEE
ncbi:HlyD family type I secretion periplasmic adaptor subunit [Rhizobium sophorae]|uniref:Membrane fusion protein (MFP) family protein n=1 Tax=Rhizobium sophorae TaxID=1535242 RepID=A0A7Y3S573_9HYPH|nr:MULTISPECIES: HlyD family type I secretion periplasmic adaptor subunit [Rhizobium]MBB4388423.1 HlyD family secretion protein [Rhizobium leguminosarum]NNU37281.1 HlyD family type I secretion periplasmic adaptor subunit [Rhizobium sophorae]PCK84923.1 hemolysin secretion protein D [Rhizobium sophoriradicis]PDS74978.1 hemolysin secretion protein D [Rhizobium sp. L43]ULJ76833.1 HlyD family type I secretion periplasmic adaptor subunit [Rhizobium sp. C104]